MRARRLYEDSFASGRLVNYVLHVCGCETAWDTEAERSASLLRCGAHRAVIAESLSRPPDDIGGT